MILFCTKFHHLPEAIEEARPFVGETTQILSVINGITSEKLLADAFGEEKVLYCMAQGMSAVKLDNALVCKSEGFLAVGERSGALTERVGSVHAFLEQNGVRCIIPDNILHYMWGKLMTNVGCNQVTAVFEGDYGIYQKDGEARRMLLAAMREVITLAPYEGVPLTETDLDYWMELLDQLPPDGTTSMRQDMIAGRKTEVELFAGTVTELGRKHGVPTPVNDLLLKTITKMEQDQQRT